MRGGRAGWLLANRLQCNLHSYGWISNVGVLYKGIWLPAELHDMQLAPWRVATNTIACNHTDMDEDTVCDSYAGLSKHPNLRHSQTHSALLACCAGPLPPLPCFVSPQGAS